MTGIEQARAAGQLQKALTICRRVLQIDPAHAAGQRHQREVEEAILVQEVEQLSGMALGYAADGDLDLAMKIASKVQRLAPESARYRDLAAYLDEEATRRSLAALVTTAQEHIVLGNLEEAGGRGGSWPPSRTTPSPEIRDRAATVIANRTGCLRPSIATRARLPAPAPVASPARASPLPEGPPADAGAGVSSRGARLLKSRDPVKAVPLLEQASTSRPTMAPSGCSDRAPGCAGPKLPCRAALNVSCRTITRGRARPSTRRSPSTRRTGGPGSCARSWASSARLGGRSP